MWPCGESISLGAGLGLQGHHGFLCAFCALCLCTEDGSLQPPSLLAVVYLLLAARSLLLWLLWYTCCLLPEPPSVVAVVYLLLAACSLLTTMPSSLWNCRHRYTHSSLSCLWSSCFVQRQKSDKAVVTCRCAEKGQEGCVCVCVVMAQFILFEVGPSILGQIVNIGAFPIS